MHFVFVPGVGHGGWCWHPVGQRIHAAGHSALALTMPGLSLGDDPRGLRLVDAVDHLVGEVERRDLTDVVLVGHSWAGFPITAAAPRLAARLARIVFYSAYVPLPGESMASALGPETAEFMRATAEASPDGTIGMDFETFANNLMPGEPAAAQRVIYDQLLPTPGGYVLDPIETDGIYTTGIPITYVLSENDRSLAAPGLELAARVGVQPIMVPGTHEALLTHPDEVTKGLLADLD
ncbi:alpha/beta hydrolase family protein [Streptomyces minutiscleroticus]|uniref:Salicylate esterase n=1 Tax=Streptomyces minutiscleroticus TaxID=68238 RepID=A0A918P5A0_9ACTN|nr:alpha/beta hydrolase family protein [Streptomyces minutiscleroticus]GGY19081.1 salicylate esterase [Streptomyces minutiscleroticus]